MLRTIILRADNIRPYDDVNENNVGDGGLACRLGRCFCINAEVSTGHPHPRHPAKLKVVLDKSMIDNTDFSAFSKWYEKEKDTGVYHHSNSFLSGYTTHSTTMFLTVLFCNAFEKLKKLAPFALIISFVYVALMGYSRIIAGATYLSDVVGGAIIGYTILLIAMSLYSLFNKKGILPTRHIK